MAESDISRKVVYMIPVMFLLAIVLVYAWIYFYTDAYVNIRSEDIIKDNTIIIQRVLNSPNCFTYKDSRERVYIGIIEQKKFTDENFKKCVDYGGQRNLRLSLVRYPDNTIIKEIYNNDDKSVYNGIAAYNAFKYVLIKDYDGELDYLKLKKALLWFEQYE